MRKVEARLKSLEAENAKLKKQQAAAKHVAADGGDSPEVELADTEMAPGTSDLEKRIGDAQGAVAKLEAIPEASRDLFKDFEERLASARTARDVLLRERRDAKPWIWRLKGAEKATSRAEKAKTKAVEAVDEILAQQLALGQLLDSKRALLEKAHAAHVEALANVAAIRAEAAGGKADAGHVCAPRAGVSAEEVARVVAGLVGQLNELPKAVAAGNFEAALKAALSQAQALLPGVSGDTSGSGTATGQLSAAAGAGTSSAAARSAQRPYWAASPRAVSCNSDTDDEEGRSRSRERRETEHQERDKTTRDVVEGRQRTIRDAMARGAA
jgi:hypothetical protein